MRRLHSCAFGLLSAVVASACQRPHVHGAGCEAGLVPTAASAGAFQSGDAPATPPAAELDPTEALATFDQAWRTVYETHFDPAFNGVDWKALESEFRPRAGQARTRADLRALLDEMLGRLGQSHFAVIPSDALPADAEASDQSGGLGFDVRLRDGRLLVVALDPGGAAADAGVRLGWSLTRIDDFEANDARARLGSAAEELGSRRVAFHLWEGARRRILGPVGGRSRVGFLDGADAPLELELERRARNVTAHSFGTTLPTFYLEFQSGIVERHGRQVGRLAFSNWFLPVMKPLDEAVDRLRACHGIVLDLRGNTGGAAAMTMGVSGHFFREATRLGVMLTRDATLNILAVPRVVNAAGERVEPFAGPVAIVVDETTGSASEVFAGGMQAVGRARIFGETSAGAVLPAMTTRLPNGDTLLHALGDFETATGERLEGRGVVPDVLVPRERTALLAGRDAQLEAALEWASTATR